MTFSSFLANKCFEYLLKFGDEEKTCQIDISDQPSHLPPWAIEPKHFHSVCDGCGLCIETCPHKLLVLSKKNYPVIDFSSGACNFCGACAEHCSRGALHYDPSTPPWKLKASISDACLSNKNVLCRTCAEHCDQNAILVPQANGAVCAPHVVAEKCNGCGGCIDPCPVNAISATESRKREKIPTEEVVK